MSWITIKEYIQRFGSSDSTIRRAIKLNKIRTRRDGQKILLWVDESKNREIADGGPIQNGVARLSNEQQNGDFSKFSISQEMSGSLADVIAFSSKALNSYLMMSEKLIGEKEKRLEEKDGRIEEKELMIRDQRQKIAELESYIKTLEAIWRSHRE